MRGRSVLNPYAFGWATPSCFSPHQHSDVYQEFHKTEGSERVAGPSTTTNGSGGYVMRFTFPASAKGNYDVRICAGTEIRPSDGRCAQIVFGIS